VDSTVKSKFMYLTINLDKTQYPTSNLSSELFATTEELPDMVCIDLNASAYPGKQLAHLSTVGVSYRIFYYTQC